MLDYFEWVGGFRPKFGIIGVDRTTQARTPKLSARRLGDVARTGQL
ncbi:MAG: family 1 glycosylhydrolase [Chloroflexi bacterium]|nr:family 1 glycosylhydrolase [Chloroflexota bacterium]